MSFTEEIIEKLNKVISNKMITQRELAKKVGVYESAVSDWKIGRTFPKKDNLKKLENILDNLLK